MIITPQAPLEYPCDRLDRWGEQYGDIGDAWVNAKYILEDIQTTNRTFDPDVVLLKSSRSSLVSERITPEVGAVGDQVLNCLDCHWRTDVVSDSDG